MRSMLAVLFAMATAIPTESTAADATWFCAIDGSIKKYQVVGKELRNLTDAALLKMLGIERPSSDRYQIVEDTPQGIVAVLSQTKSAAAGDNSAFVWVSVVLINKQTGAMRVLSFSTEGEANGDRPVHGQCEAG